MKNFERKRLRFCIFYPAFNDQTRILRGSATGIALKEMPPSSISYKNDDLKVIWKPALCKHSRLCWVQLRSVFNPTKKPWVNMEGASSARIVEQVKKCPSGALSFEWLKEPVTSSISLPVDDPKKDEISRESILQVNCEPNGPLIIPGTIKLIHSDGRETIEEDVWLCRCGGSKNKPYCDGSHETNGFKS